MIDDIMLISNTSLNLPGGGYVCEFVVDSTKSSLNERWCCKTAHWVRKNSVKGIKDGSLKDGSTIVPMYPYHAIGAAFFACEDHKYEFIEVGNSSEEKGNKWATGTILTLKASNAKARITGIKMTLANSNNKTEYNLIINGNESGYIPEEELIKLVKEND